MIPASCLDRLASLSERRVKQDQRLVEDTLGSNRQSELEKDFSAFFDGERIDVCEIMQSKYLYKEEDFIFIYYPRLACIILEVHIRSIFSDVTDSLDSNKALFH